MLTGQVTFKITRPVFYICSVYNKIQNAEFSVGYFNSVTVFAVCRLNGFFISGRNAYPAKHKAHYYDKTYIEYAKVCFSFPFHFYSSFTVC